MNWISVKDQKPPADMERFLAISRFNDTVFIAKQRGWGDKDMIVGGLHLTKDIRYWMPLPDAPGEDMSAPSNADRIRAMSDEELHKFCVSLTDDGWRFACENKPECDPVPPQAHMCNDCFLNWLRQPFKED